MTIRLEEGSKFWHHGRLLDIEAANGNYDQWQQRSTDFVRDASKMFRRRQKSGCAFLSGYSCLANAKQPVLRADH